MMFIFSLLLLFSLLSADGEQFVIPSKKNHSRVALKEQLGENFKQVIDGCSSVVNKAGELLIKTKVNHQCVGRSLTIISKIQKDLSSKTQALIENRKPFKKASRAQLNFAIEMMRQVAALLDKDYTFDDVYVNKLSNIQSKINNCL